MTSRVRILNGTTETWGPNPPKFHNYEQLAASCPSLIRITIIDGTLTEVIESDSDVYIFKREDSETDEEPTSDNVGLNCINQTP